MRTVRILDEAAMEAAEAAAWYEVESPGMGAKFSAAVEYALDCIEEETLPLLTMQNESGVQPAKRILLKRFPYDIVTIARQNEILVIAVAHHARLPGYWRNRLKT